MATRTVTWVEVTLVDPGDPYGLPELDGVFTERDNAAIKTMITEAVEAITNAVDDADADTFALCLTVQRVQEQEEDDE